MKLPENFQFSQGSLQAYGDCPRLFQLRYIERLAWPAPEVEPALENERYMQLGSDFHRLVQQFLLGIPTERLANIAGQDERLAHWWQNFQDDGPNLSDYTHYNEVALSGVIGEQRIVAKYDLLAVERTGDRGLGRVIIYDWKTSRKLPKREWQEQKLQTRVYPFLLVKAGAQLNSGLPIAPEQIEMVYWFSNFPTAPMKFKYDQEKFAADEAFISGLVAEIGAQTEGKAPKTDIEKRCKFCVYRSLCNRGVAAGTIAELENDLDEGDGLDFELDFEQIAEIEF
jgi:hypothetical protein